MAEDFEGPVVIRGDLEVKAVGEPSPSGTLTVFRKGSIKVDRRVDASHIETSMAVCKLLVVDDHIRVLSPSGGPAGLFLGDVDARDFRLVSGEVGGQVGVTLRQLVDRLGSLEQQVAQLTQQVAALESITPTPGPKPVISVELRLNPTQVRVTGQGFDRSEPVSLEVKTTTSSGFASSASQTLTATTEGKIETSQFVSCSPGVTSTHTVIAKGLNSRRESAPQGVSC